MRATLLVAMALCSVALVSSQDINPWPKPAEYAAYLSNIESMFTADMEGTVGKMLADALNGWNYTLPLEYVRKGQAYIGPSVRLRRVINDLREGEKQHRRQPCIAVAQQCCSSQTIEQPC